MAASAPNIRCIEKWRLIQEYSGTVSELSRLSSAQVAAAMDGQGFRFQHEMATVADRKDQAKYAILIHEHTHGC